MRRIAWVRLLLAGCAVALGIALSLGPWKAYWKQRQETEATLREMQRLESTHAELTKRKARLEGAVGMEEEARKAGFKRREEVSAESTP